MRALGLYSLNFSKISVSTLESKRYFDYKNVKSEFCTVYDLSSYKNSDTLDIKSLCSKIFSILVKLTILGKKIHDQKVTLDLIQYTDQLNDLKVNVKYDQLEHDDLEAVLADVQQLLKELPYETFLKVYAHLLSEFDINKNYIVNANLANVTSSYVLKNCFLSFIDLFEEITLSVQKTDPNIVPPIEILLIHIEAILVNDAKKGKRFAKS